MKKPSGPKADYAPREFTYFVDRCLGKRFPRLLAESGLEVTPYHRWYPSDDRVSDLDWLVQSCRVGHVALSHDKSMRFTDSTMEGFFTESFEKSAALFVLRGDQRAEEHAQMFLSAKIQIERMTTKYRRRRTPFVAHVVRAMTRGAKEIVKVEKRLDLAGWIDRQSAT